MITLRELLKAINEELESLFEDPVEVCVSVVSRRQVQGVIYLEVTAPDLSARAKAVIFSTATSFDCVEAGATVGLVVSPIINTDYGFNLIVHGARQLEAVRHQVHESRNTLVELGLFDLLKRYSLEEATFKRVGVLAPRESAAIGDFNAVTAVLQRTGELEVVVHTVGFQGPYASDQINEGITTLAKEHKRAPFDAMVIIRGGGDSSFINCLNDLSILKRIALMPIPVMVAVGHNRDQTLLGEIATVEMSTPSACGTWFVDRYRQRLLHAHQSISSVLSLVEQCSNQYRTVLSAIHRDFFYGELVGQLTNIRQQSCSRHKEFCYQTSNVLAFEKGRANVMWTALRDLAVAIETAGIGIAPIRIRDPILDKGVRTLADVLIKHSLVVDIPGGSFEVSVDRIIHDR